MPKLVLESQPLIHPVHEQYEEMPSLTPPHLQPSCDEDINHLHPAKKLKRDESVKLNTRLVEGSLPLVIASHPLGVKPAGNAYGVTQNLRRSAGLFQLLPDDLLTLTLEYLDGPDLIGLGATCKALYAFCHSDELWKALCLESLPQQFEWQGSWRSTYIGHPRERRANVSCQGLFSDTLYRPFQCAHLPLAPYADIIPRNNSLPRLEDLSEEEFNTSWFDQPFILTSPVRKWPIHSEESRWTTDRLVEKYGSTVFRAESVDWPLELYAQYMKDCADEESPLYLFDQGFAEKMCVRVGTSADTKDAAYWPPECFGEDLFSLLVDQRPDCRWLIIGPAGSGSTFHKDPNATSAWNAVITGSKYWLMFPPSHGPPPGVFLSSDAAEITSPLSIAEYLLTFHAEARASVGCREAVCRAGEVLYVPSGWFHLVVNLEESVAVTQNFVPEAKLVDVLAFLRDTPDQVSGFAAEVEDPFRLFVERLRESKPQLLEEALRRLDARKLAKNRNGGKWDAIVKGESNEDANESSAPFCFGFASGEEEDDEER